MTRTEQLDYLIRTLEPALPLPESDGEKWQLFRSLMNVRGPLPVTEEFLRVQDALLEGEIACKGITDAADLTPYRKNLYVWKGDITTLKADAVVNAANSQMLGCFSPCHGCIDNAIHTFAGVQLRLECAEIMERQGHAEPVGKAKITKAYNLPSRWIIHTVGPMVSGSLTQRDRSLLASCYRSCLKLVVQNRLRSIAFCCISTGEFHFPNRAAAQIAVHTVQRFLESQGDLNVIFNVFQDKDDQIYRELLSENTP